MRVGLVGCVKSKRPEAAPAADLYTSPLFRGRRAAVESSCDRWFILSALHGLVVPSQTLEPYDLAMTDLAAADRRAWAERVLSSLRTELHDLGAHTYEIHAGAAYTDHGLVARLCGAGGEVVNPVRGMRLGAQLAWYRRTRPADGGGVEDAGGRGGAPPRPARSGARGRYLPLAEHLASRAEPQVTLGFDEIEAILGVDLPASAGRHRAWWSNGGHVQAQAWLSAGYEVDDVDPPGRSVRFRRRK
jgi:hypothetical protein